MHTHEGTGLSLSHVKKKFPLTPLSTFPAFRVPRMYPLSPDEKRRGAFFIVR